MEYKFSDLFKWTSGKPIVPTDGDIPIYGSNGIIGYTDTAKYKDRIILGRVGAYCGSVSYCPNEFNATDNTLITTCDTSKIIYYYAFYLLKLYDLNKFAGGSAQPLITQSILKRLKCEIPDLSTQHKITSILSAYDNLIENNTRRIRLLEHMAENIYKEWFVRFRFPGHENVGYENGLPKSWITKKLGDFIKFERGVGYGSKDIKGGRFVLLSMNNIRPFGGFIPDYSRPYSGSFKDYQIVKKDDLIMCITDMTQDRRIIGYTGLVPPGKGNRIICTHLMKLTSSHSHPYFLYGLFNYSGLSKIIAERATGANVLGLTADNLRGVKVFLPPEDLQLLYMRKVSPIIEATYKLNSINDILTRQRDLLLPRLMSGKLEVH
jgi:type I restriction enzyme S subunit